MPYYQPSQANIKFIYSKGMNNVCINSDVTVPLNPGETMAKRNAVYDSAAKSVIKTFDFDPNGPQVNPNNYQESSGIEVLNPVKTIYDPNNINAFKNGLRKELAASYNVTVNLNPKPDGTEPKKQDTQVLSSAGEITIA